MHHKVLPFFGGPWPVLGGKPHIELPSATVDVPRVRPLFIRALPADDTLAAMGSHMPGAQNEAGDLLVVGE